MTEKRFTLGKVACYRTRLIKDNGVKLGNSKICDLLNELSDENNLLKQKVDSLIEELNHKTNLELIEDRKHLDDR